MSEPSTLWFTVSTLPAMNSKFFKIRTHNFRFASLKYPINRRGGNAETAYNWKNGVSNRAWDWYFLSVADVLSAPTTSLPEGTELAQFVDETRSSNATVLLTASTIGYKFLYITHTLDTLLWKFQLIIVVCRDGVILLPSMALSRKI